MQPERQRLSELQAQRTQHAQRLASRYSKPRPGLPGFVIFFVQNIVDIDLRGQAGFANFPYMLPSHPNGYNRAVEMSQLDRLVFAQP